MGLGRCSRRAHRACRDRIHSARSTIEDRLEVTVLDVGQGDSIFAAFPDGRTMLIDGGGLPAPNGSAATARARMSARRSCRRIYGRGA